MGMSAKFQAAGSKTVTENFIPGVRQTLLVDISDWRLLRLIEGVEDAITVKETWLYEHEFPDSGGFYLNKVTSELEKLTQRHKDLITEKERRGL